MLSAPNMHHKDAPKCDVIEFFNFGSGFCQNAIFDKSKLDLTINDQDIGNLMLTWLLSNHSILSLVLKVCMANLYHRMVKFYQILTILT